MVHNKCHLLVFATTSMLHHFEPLYVYIFHTCGSVIVLVTNQHWDRRFSKYVTYYHVSFIASVLWTHIVFIYHLWYKISATDSIAKLKMFISLIILLCYRKCHIVSFLFTFAYLFFFRMTEFFGIPYPPAHTNLVQMMVTLKVNNGFIFNI
jgi:hypothetical protein